MRRLTRNQRGGVRSGMRGVAFLWTILIGLPLAFLGLSMAVDLTRIVIAGREVNTAAQAAALSGAYQFTPGKATIDATRATAAATETMCVAATQGEIHNAAAGQKWRVSCPGGTKVSVRVVMDSATKLTVTSEYEVPNLLLLHYFGYGKVDGSASRSAAICNAADAKGPTAGYCNRPRT